MRTGTTSAGPAIAGLDNAAGEPGPGTHVLMVKGGGGFSHTSPDRQQMCKMTGQHCHQHTTDDAASSAASLHPHEWEQIMQSRQNPLGSRVAWQASHTCNGCICIILVVHAGCLPAGHGQQCRTGSVGSLGRAVAGRLGSSRLRQLCRCQLRQLRLLQRWGCLGRSILCSSDKQSLVWACHEHKPAQIPSGDRSGQGSGKRPWHTSRGVTASVICSARMPQGAAFTAFTQSSLHAGLQGLPEGWRGPGLQAQPRPH